MASVPARGAGRRRRTMNEINMVPFIDVMLVLLIIFMVSAPLISTGVVDLPTVGKSKQQPQDYVEILIGADKSYQVRAAKGEPQPVTLAQLVPRLRDAMGDDAETPVVISADRKVEYDQVMKAMNALQDAGVRRIALVAKKGP